MGLPLRDTKYHTYRDYLSWPETVRYELIDGIAYLMTGPLRRHQEVLGQLYRQVADALDGHPCRPFIAPFDVRLPRANEADAAVDTVVQPDLLVVCDERKLDERGCRGAPDWVLEVLSPSTASHDLTVKRLAYQRAGVREIWFLHPTDRVLIVFSRQDNGEYAMPQILEAKDSTAIGILPEVAIDWLRVLGEPPLPTL